MLARVLGLGLGCVLFASSPTTAYAQYEMLGVPSVERLSVPAQLTAMESPQSGRAGWFNWPDVAALKEQVASGAVTLVGATLALSSPTDHVETTTTRAVRTTVNGQYAQVPLGSVGPAMTGVTVRALVKRSATGNYTQYVAYRNNGFWLGITSSGGAQFGVFTNGAWTYAIDASGNLFPVGQWHEIQGVYDGTTMYLYVDGRLRTTAAKTGTIPSATGSWFISGFGASSSVRGDVTGVWVNSRALFPTLLIHDLARWDFATSTGTTLRSIAKIKNRTPEDGTIVGAVFVDQPSPSRSLRFTGATQRVTALGVVTSRALQQTVDTWILRESSPAYQPYVIDKPNSFSVKLTTAGELLCSFNDISGVVRVASTAAIRSVPLSQWTHVGCSFDGATVRAFINGKLVTSTVGGKGYYSTTDGLTVGNSAAFNVGFIGHVADMRVRNGASSSFSAPADRAAQYDWTATGPTSLPNLKDTYGTATFTNAPWTATTVSGFRELGVNVASGNISFDGKVLSGSQELGIQLWTKIVAAPGATSVLISRTNSFSLEITADMRPVWKVQIPRPGTLLYDVVTADAGIANMLTVGTWHHVAGHWYYDGQNWVATLYVDGIARARATAEPHRAHDIYSTAAICVGSCGGGAVNGLVSDVVFAPAPPSPYCCMHPVSPLPIACAQGEGGSYVVNHEYITTDPVGHPDTGIEHYWATDSHGVRCTTAHPIVLVQGMGQHAESWAMCYHDFTGAFTTNSGVSLGTDNSGCEDGFHRGHNTWCPDWVFMLVRGRGADVITINFDKAQRDFNLATSFFPWNKDWMKQGGTQTSTVGATGAPRAFVPYSNMGHYYKGGFTTGLEEYGRRGRIIDNAYVLSLVLEYMYPYLGSRKFTVVGHSMGGIVANAATVGRSWKQVKFNDTDPQDNAWLGRDDAAEVYQVITLSAPHLGARFLNLGNSILSSLNFTNLFDNQSFDDTDWLEPGADEFEGYVYNSLSVTTRVYAEPATCDLLPGTSPLCATIQPQAIGMTAMRGFIDARIAALPPATIPPHYELAGTYSTVPGCSPLGLSLVTEEETRESSDFRQLVQRMTSASTDLYQFRTNSDNEAMSCRGADFYTGFVSTDCSYSPSSQWMCMNSVDIVHSFRAVGDKQGMIWLWFEVPANPDPGKMQAAYRGWGDDMGFTFWLNDATKAAAGFGTTVRENDGAACVDESTGLPSSYGTAIWMRKAGGLSCLTSAGVPLTHHQMRIAQDVLKQNVCDPALTPPGGGCASTITMLDLVGR